MSTNPENIQSSRLANGVLVITEIVPGLETAAIGLWADAGSADEAPEEFGLAHFLEHMLFKGTDTRSPFALAEAIEDVGGQLNAYTEAEITQLSARVLADHLPMAVDLLADMACHSTFAQEEIERERQVVIEEILKYESLPEDRVHDLLMAGLWSGGGLGHSILGSEQSVRAFTRADLHGCWRRHFSTERVLLTAAGKLNHAELAAQAEEAFVDLPTGAGVFPAYPSGERVSRQIVVEEADQVHFAWGGRTYPAGDDRNFALAMLDAALGGSTTSRLFQEIREKRGLAYDIGSFSIGFRDTGFIATDGAASPESFLEMLELVRREILLLRTEGISTRELARAKEQMKAGMALSLESTVERMRRLAMHQLTWGAVRSLGELIERMSRVTVDEIRGVMDDVLDLDHWTFAAVGPVDEARVGEIIG